MPSVGLQADAATGGVLLLSFLIEFVGIRLRSLIYDT
jgi:hypothetical protein